MRNKALLCLLLALSLLAGPAAQAVKWEYPVSDHPEVDYEDMLPVTGFDETELVAALEELESVCGRNSRPGAKPASGFKLCTTRSYPR